jgi:signal transduction histidine kinase
MVNAEQLMREPLCLRTWFAENLAGWQARAELAGRRLQIEVTLPDELPAILVDEARLQQVMKNLLDNACKFSAAGSAVRVTSRIEGRHVLVAVSDQGIGVPAHEATRIFECFYQVDGGTRRVFGGMGIGLALCRAIVEAHGGSIWVESPGRNLGSTFYFTLPLVYARLEVTSVEGRPPLS